MSAYEEERACPCHYVTPCRKQCSCANPYLSGGCLRCCLHGSLEQRQAAATHIAQAMDAYYEALDKSTNGANLPQTRRPL